jgi:hypothetical protein
MCVIPHAPAQVPSRCRGATGEKYTLSLSRMNADRIRLEPKVPNVAQRSHCIQSRFEKGWRNGQATSSGFEMASGSRHTATFTTKPDGAEETTGTARPIRAWIPCFQQVPGTGTVCYSRSDLPNLRYQNPYLRKIAFEGADSLCQA